MHGYTNFQQSKALWEHGYRHPKPIRWDGFYKSIEYPSFSLADLVTMQGAIYHVPAIAPMKDIIQSYVDSALVEEDELVQQSNERLKQAYGM